MLFYHMSNYQDPYKKCDCCGHYFQGSKIAKWQSGFNVKGPIGMCINEIVHTWWLCEDCYNGQLAVVESRIAGAVVDRFEPSYKERLYGTGPSTRDSSDD